MGVSAFSVDTANKKYKNRLQGLGDGEAMFSTVNPASKKTVHRLLSFDFQYLVKQKKALASSLASFAPLDHTKRKTLI